MALYRYRPKGNRTPVSHPLFGHLEWDGIYSDPQMAGDPNFQEIKAQPPAEQPSEDPGTDDNPIVVKAVIGPVDKPSADSKTDAGKPGRSTTK